MTDTIDTPTTVAPIVFAKDDGNIIGNAQLYRDLLGSEKSLRLTANSVANVIADLDAKRISPFHAIGALEYHVHELMAAAALDLGIPVVVAP